MRFIHLGDLHLGKTLGEFDLLGDQRFILDQILRIAEEKKADAVLLAGDVYDRPVPSEGAVNLFDYFIRELAARGLMAFIIPGNHDSDDRLNFGSSLFESNGIYLSARYGGKLYKRTVKDAEGNVNFYLLPFVKASRIRHLFPEEEIADYEGAVRVVLSHEDIDASERNVLVAHQFVVGKGGDPELAGSENPATLNVGSIERIGADCFDMFDYVALGHIHSPQGVGRDAVRYSGSPLKYSLSEAGRDKSVPVVTLGKKGEVEVELIPLAPMRNLRHIRGTLKQLLDKNNVCDTEDFIYATLTDEETVSDAMGIFRQYYPNTVRIDYDNSHTKEIQQVDIRKIAEKKSFGELICEFYRMVYGCEISGDELMVMKKIAGEAGVLNETGEA